MTLLSENNFRTNLVFLEIEGYTLSFNINETEALQFFRTGGLTKNDSLELSK